MKSHLTHNFHIPVMGLGFTIDSPIKVGKYAISSVISIIEDHLMEQMRESLSAQENIPYKKILEEEEDYRARRITAYLNLLQTILAKQMAKMQLEDFEKDYDINQYFKLLPNSSPEKKIYDSLDLYRGEEKTALYQKLKKMLVAGSIDVNIMTKLDKTNYDTDGNELPSEYSDALSALRGYANSDLDSSIIFSAGMNPRLFSYCEQFSDFFPDAQGYIKKRIILKVSDYRSALIQGKYLAKKGLWVSEYRVESGINCGGHAFISNGILLGPILEEFKNKKEELYNEVYNDCNNGLTAANKLIFKHKPQLNITVQGGVGSAQENNFLLEYYNLDSIGWGSPFLLVPEATNVDYDTLQKLSHAHKDDYYLSHASPLGVPFNNFRLSSSENQRKARIEKNRPGSPCYKKFLSNNTEFTDRAICTASRQYQNLKIEQLKTTTTNETVLEKQIELVMEKDCLCEGLGASALLVNKAKLSHNLDAVTICPGPNLAYFSGIFSLKQMVDHIYGRVNILNDVFRPNCFINELELYIDYFKKEIEKHLAGISTKNNKYFMAFKQNLSDGITYYEDLCKKTDSASSLFPISNMQLLQRIKVSINQLYTQLSDDNKQVAI